MAWNKSLSDSDYEGSFTIDAPIGIYQGNGDTNVNTRYAYRAENIRTDRGLIASCFGTSLAFPSLWKPVETLMRFYKRATSEEIWVAAADRHLWYTKAGMDHWEQLKDGSGNAIDFNSNKWSSITYEAVHGTVNTDVLLMTNTQDGMVCVYGDTLSCAKVTMAIGDDYATVKFGCIGRYAERIWGTGADGYPDHIFYSKPYDPLDWTQNNDNPELGGGVIQQPTWDGEAFVAVKPFGGYIIACKPSTIYEIRGTDPSNYTITQAFGTDAPTVAKSIQTDLTSMFYLTREGIGLYNGTAATLLSQDALYETFMARGSDSYAVSCVNKHIYYLAIPVATDTGTPAYSNVLITYDTTRSAFMIRTGLAIRDLYSIGGKVYYTSAVMPYDICLLDDENASSDLGAPIASVWETAWLDLGKTLRKEDFTIRFSAEADEEDVPITLEVINEKNVSKSKVVYLHEARRDYRVRINHRGNRVKLRLTAKDRPSGWRIIGGVQVAYSYDSNSQGTTMK